MMVFADCLSYLQAKRGRVPSMAYFTSIDNMRVLFPFLRSLRANFLHFRPQRIPLLAFCFRQRQ
ncbi:MAG: hypothetical protein DYH08_17655, partial [Actinobacteria bacterium ATB1]|nr:hypothetical protein [Actinobacteria bacterium ATB1]